MSVSMKAGSVSKSGGPPRGERVCPTCLLFTGVLAQRVALRVRHPGPIGSHSPVCPLRALCCVCGVVGHLAPVQQCARSVCCVACADSWATWLLFTGAPVRCVVLRLQCPGRLGCCSPVCSLGVLCCVCGVLGHLAPALRCARSACCVVCAASWATWLMFAGVPARCRPVRYVACGLSLATWLLFTGVLARRVVLRMRRPWPLGSCSRVRRLGMSYCVCGILGHLAPVHWCARSVPTGALCCVWGVLGHLAPVHRCARSACCVACATSWATWVLITGVLPRRVALRVRRPGPLDSCSPVCLLGASCCVCAALGHLAPVHRCVRSVRCAACAVSWATSLLFSGVPAPCVVLRVRRPGALGSCSSVRTPGGSFCVCGVLGHLGPVHRCARSACCSARAVSWTTWLLLTAVLARCVVLRVLCAVSRATWLLFTGVRTECAVLCVVGVAAGRVHVHPDGGFW